MKKVFLFLSAITLFTSCGDEVFDINRDPDNLDPNSAALSTQMPAGVVGVAGAQGSYYALIGGFWAQHWTQGNSSNQYKEIDDYSLGTVSPYSTGWQAMYDALGDIRNVKRKAEAEGNWNYYLIATTMEVHASQLLVDFYDQIPYTEANNVNILQPNFDSGEQVYNLMAEDLQMALSHDLSTSEGEVPAADDFVFAGDMASWRAFANTLLLKLYIRQSEARPAVSQAGIEALVASGEPFLNEDAAMTQFEDEPNRSNPLYETDRRQLNTGINLRASRTTFSFLQENADPRITEYYNPGNPLNQGDFNSTLAQTSIAVVKLSPTTPVYFMSHEESLFLQAEALERTGASGMAAYNQGVVENFSKWGMDGSAFVAPGGAYEYPAAGDFQTKLRAIIMQKWVSMFPGNGFEAFFEQNRTGYPEISPVPQTSDLYVPGELSYSINGVTGGDFPKRLVFPSTVTSRNSNAPALVENTVPVWWDVTD